ncbi:MAG: glycosyltransferase family 2 protein [bacterium]|nr:MAG: glycosyltransferase family 2 protein [bacterium]
MKTKVSIIILTTNALSMTKEQLLDVAKLDTGNLDVECMIVDNGSPDGTEEALKDYKLSNMKYKFIQSGANLGFAGGNNVGIKDAVRRKFDYIILMNNDLILQKDIVVKLVDYMKKNPEVGIASPKMYFAKGYEFHKDRYKTSEKGNVLWYAGGIIDKHNVYTSHRGVDEIDKGQYDKIEETDVANGACVIVKREVFKKVGLLDASFFLYWEDADFSERVIRAGYKVMYYPDTWMWHKVSASTGGSGSPTNDYFLIRNRFYYSMRYSPLRTKFAVLRDTVRQIFTGRTWQKWGAIDALLGRKGMGQWKYR